MDEAKLPEEAVDGLSDDLQWVIALAFTLFLGLALWWTKSWHMAFLPLILACVGYRWNRAALLVLLGIVGVGGAIDRELGSLQFVVSPILGIGPAAVVIAFTEGNRTRILFGLSSLIATAIGTFSGNLGSAGRIFNFFTQTLGINPTTAESLVFVVRKSVHIGCYGVLAALILQLMPKDKPARWLGAALAAMTFAGFDEWRQTQSPGRTGTAWDLLWDMLGVVLALGLVIGIPKWREKRLSGSGLAS